MKKFIFLFVFTTLLVGCSEEITDGKNSSNSNKMPNIEQKEEANKTADYTEVYIQEINKNHIIISPYATDPEASYPVYEIYIDEKTKIEGKRNSKEELQEDDDIEVWIRKQGVEKLKAEKVFINN